MNISGFLKETYLDYPGKLACEIFTSGCNFNCPTCHAKHINYSNENFSEDEIFSYLESRKGWINGIVICGGEPTLQHGLKYFLQEIREKFPELSIKLDTNGSYFAVLDELKQEKLVDYAAMDLKGPVEMYRKLTGIEKFDLRDNLGKGIGLVSMFPEHEYRTTVVPVFENEKPRWMSVDEIIETSRLPYKWTGTREHRYFLQKFVAREKGIMLDDRFCKENISQEFWETPESLLEEAEKRIKQEGTLTEYRIRGK